MVIKVEGKTYRVSEALSQSCSKSINDLLVKVREKSRNDGIEDYYTAFVLYMYVISLGILRNLSLVDFVDNVKAVQEEEQKKE